MKFFSSKPSSGVIAVFGIALIITMVGIRLWGPSYERVAITMGGEVFDTRIADTPSKRTRGLSGTDAIGRNEAMIFVWERDLPYAIWMKDMNYAIDIIWVNDGVIVDMAPRVPPAVTDVEADIPVYKPRLPADRVVEVAAGTIDRLGLSIGDPVSVVAD